MEPQSEQETTPPRAIPRVLLWTVCTGLVVLTVASALLLVTYGYGRDQGIYHAVGRVVAQGGMPYRDAWDFKPPGIFVVYAAAHGAFGAVEWGVRLLELAAFLALFPAFARISRRAGLPRGAGWAAAAVALYLHARLGFWHTGQPESFGAALVVWGLALDPASAATRRGRLALGFAVGVLWTAAALMKPPLGAGFPVTLAAAVLARRAAGDPRAWLDPIASWGAGALVVLGSTWAWFAARGAWPDLVATLFEFAPHYASIDASSLGLGGLGHDDPGLAQGLLQAARDSVPDQGGYMFAGLALLLVSLGSPRSRPAFGTLLQVVLVLGLLLLGVVLQGKYFTYHYGAALPLAALLATWGWWRALVYASGRPLLQASVALIAGGLLLATGNPHGFGAETRTRFAALLDAPEERRLALDTLDSFGSVRTVQLRRAANRMAELAGPDESIYIWGFEPQVYLHARRRAATRYVYNVPQRTDWSKAEARERLLAELAADPPAAVAVERRDLLPWVTGNLRDSVGELEDFPELAAWLEAHYALLPEAAEVPESTGWLGNLQLYGRR